MVVWAGMLDGLSANPNGLLNRRQRLSLSGALLVSCAFRFIMAMHFQRRYVWLPEASGGFCDGGTKGHCHPLS